LTGITSTLYRPAEVARLLRCSEWWVKEQARQRRIPYCWIGGGYRFTDAHLTEIVRMFEVRPADAPVPLATRQAAPSSAGGPALLRARPPRRLRSVATPEAA